MNLIEKYQRAKDQKARQLKQLPDWENLEALEHRANSLIFPRGLIVDDLHRFFQNTESCGSNVKKVSEHGKSDKFTRHTCQKGKYCKICSNKDTNGRRHHIKDHAPQGNVIVYLATFTHEDTPNLYKALENHKQTWRNWQLQGQKDRTGEYSKVIAGVRSIEVKRGSNSGLWHPHLHALLWAWNTPEQRIDYAVYDTQKKARIVADTWAKHHRAPTKEELLPAANALDGDGKPISKITREWMKAGGGRNVDVKPVYIPGKTGDKLLKNAITETLKYALKTSDFHSEHNLESIEDAATDLITSLDALRGVRQVDYLGSLRKERKTAAEKQAEAVRKQVAAIEQYTKKEYETYSTKHDTIQDTTATDGLFDLFPQLKKIMMSDRARAACEYKRRRDQISGDNEFFEAENSPEKVQAIREAIHNMKLEMSSINRAALTSIEQVRQHTPTSPDEARQRDWFASRQYEKKIIAIHQKRREAEQAAEQREIERIIWQSQNMNRARRAEIAITGLQMSLF